MVSETKRSAFVSRSDIALSDSEIMKSYLGISTVPCVISSPLRDDDVNPSFSIFTRGGDVFWKDFGTGDAGNIISLMAKLWHVDYQEALYKIKLDLDQRIPHFNLIRRYKGKLHIVQDSTIEVRVRDWKDWDREYWASYGISEKFCKWCNVYPISHAFFTRKDPETQKEQTITVPMDKYGYAYFEWKDGKKSVKLYQPFSDRMKWLSKHDSSVWDLWKQAFKWADEKSNKELIITSSRKDAMCLWENLKVPAMSLQGEGYIPKPQVMKQVLDKFERVYLWYDNDFKHKDDNPGQDNAKKLIEMYPQLHNICIPASLESKDPSDLYKNHGVIELINVWENQR